MHAEQLEGLWPDLRDKLRDLRDQVGSVRRLDSGPDELRIRIGDAAGHGRGAAGGARRGAGRSSRSPAPAAASSRPAPRATCWW